jgi:septal ring factor EnvC (AmiA/AmiB activator)
MFNPNESDQRLEMRDASGRTVGYCLPVQEFERQFGNGTRVQQLEREQQRLQQLVRELTEERDRLREALKARDWQCAAYRKSVLALTRSDFTFTEEELRDLEQNGGSLSEVIAELERAEGTTDAR